ncbi:alkaline phosphatase D family protein [Actomonas aquatica]|uniref:Alkaline phosphatase D family protein n=1 Tax=Actomonas aquatica TaxID=2866162 RepID=A0ABZ1C3I4_9BACT|nr:alkaline phosphatase D family protein [Opitutus sp. WL0086]WRQ86276.1 alkaline phosphatase D family protein [Opitutus sp. WL0086]
MLFSLVSLRRGLALLLALALAVALPWVAAKDEDGYARILQGPMLGAVSPTTQLIWVRVSHPGDVAVVYGTDPWLEAEDTRISKTVTAADGDDRIVKIELTGLAPATTYHYRVQVAGRVDKYVAELPAWSFRTAPAVGTPAVFRVAFGSCLRLQTQPSDRIWTGLAAWSPDLFLWLGDNIYGDSRDPHVLAEEYRRMHDVQPLKPLLRSVPQLAIWDDHDFGLNNHDRTHPEKAAAYTVFRDYWANPAFGEAGNPAVYFQFNYGGVDFFMLDVRMYRDPNKEDVAHKTMLGARQLAWLKAGLQASTAPFKVLVSGSGWSGSKGEHGDAWSAFLEERDGLFDFLRDEEIGGVVLVSGDTHQGELNAMPWSDRGGYDLYEFVSSPLGQRPSQSWVVRYPEVRLRAGYTASSNVGVLEFDLSDDEPRLRFVLVDESGRRVWTPLEVRADELRNGVVSWPEKIDPAMQEAQARRAQGKPYFPAP